jgi:dihydroorotate dehydrogenase (NAD+) catalytic subunit
MKNPTLNVTIGKLLLKNPVMVASGTFGYAEEFRDFMALSALGALVTKTITLRPRQGNPPPRTCETPSGMLNSIGLENPGIEKFIEEKLPFLKKLGVPLIVSIASEGAMDEFAALARILNKARGVDAIELNISCPNIKSHGSKEGRGMKGEGRLVSQDPRATFEAVKRVRKVTRKTLITKLSPNVTSISAIAAAAERAGSDAVSLINTLTGMSIDVRTREPKIAMVTAGLSGPAIRAVAVKMVWEVYRKIKIPIIGMGGITDTASALEFIIAGATAVSVGTANFINPKVTIEVIEGIKEYLQKNNMISIRNLVGSLICKT